MAENVDKKVSFKDSLNLPQTSFPMRSKPREDDPAMIKRWEKEDLYKKTFFAHEADGNRFVFHDGPPYANGHIHLGSSYNKILKDIACKSRRMMGFQVPVTPGWDCHGLPIELKVTQEQSKDLSRPELIKACRKYAQYWVDTQRAEFKSLGVLMDWDRPYLTMNFSYEAKELEALSDFVQKGYIERSNKTVPWCFSCETVLASAEIEYADRKDPSLYVLFPLAKQSIAKAFPEHKDRSISLAVWTTTPWTLPLNRAVLFKPQTSYTILDIKGDLVLIGSSLADALCEKVAVEKKVVQEISADQLEGLFVEHPFIDNFEVPLLADHMVLTDEGTAFVHCAPGAGPQDYETGLKNNLAIFSPVGPDGCYTDEVIPKELTGISITDGQIWVIKKLAEKGRLLHKASIRHSFPHCWRCRKGLMFRATKQWFFNLTQNDLRDRAIKATDDIAMLPEKSINQLQSTIQGRLEWCISRQRVWGVPIPALICTTCDTTYITKELILKVAQGVAKEGIEYWASVSISDLVGSDFACGSCKGSSFTKEQDILDVWFDSGLSHYAVLFDNKELGFPADLYIEGKDQHRGWFQSSLLTSVALEGNAAMKSIITHGYTVDGKGTKMSKSLGNVVAPQEIIDAIGTDGLRLWASSIDFASDAIVSDVLLRNVQEVFRKVRNTCRFLLSNLYDFDINTDAVPFEKMRAIDQRALQELYAFNFDVIESYNRYDFTAASHHFGDYVSVNLSTFYFEIVKDTLYVEKADGHARRSVQTACWHILDTVTRVMAPIFSFTAEQVSDLYQKDKTESIHLQKFNDLSDIWKSFTKEENKLIDIMESQGVYAHTPTMRAMDDIKFVADQTARWDMLKGMRNAILKATESLREQNIIKRSLDAKAVLFVDPASDYYKNFKVFIDELAAKGETPEAFFKELAILSQATLAQDKQGLEESSYPGLFIAADKADGVKCPRCWQWQKSSNEHGLCDRCTAII